MTQDASSASVAQILGRVVEENRELQARSQNQGQALVDILAPYLGDINRLLNPPTNNLHVPVAGLQSGLNSELERATALVAQELIRQEAAQRARQASMQQSQKDLAEHWLASLIAAAHLQQQEQVTQQQVVPITAATSPISQEVARQVREARQMAAVKTTIAGVTNDDLPQSAIQQAPLAKKSTKKVASKPVKKKTSYKKSGVKKRQQDHDEAQDFLSYPCRCRGLPENHNARVRIFWI
jgi:hypothetical protein